jgi:hypothetical protein
MTVITIPPALEQDEPVVLDPERRQRLVDGTHRVKFLPPNAPDKARRAEQRKCLSNARLAAHSGLMDIAQAWVARATGYCPVSQRSLAAIRHSYVNGRRYRAEQAERAATRTAYARLPAAASQPALVLTIITRPGRDPELRELRIGETLSQAPPPSAAQLDTAIANLEELLARLRACRQARPA